MLSLSADDGLGALLADLSFASVAREKHEPDPIAAGSGEGGPQLLSRHPGQEPVR